jgi:diadenosine tetraphosphate (Ap4A) HIT family hydrolase
MLIRWATIEDLNKIGLSHELINNYEALVAVDRMSNSIIGYLHFSRVQKVITKVEVFDSEYKEETRERLTRVANNQLNPKGGSFHYNYPKFDLKSKKENCDVCLNMPMPDHLSDIVELDHSWVITDKKTQGKLFGKCVVGSKYHNIHFYDLPIDEMTLFMSDVQKVAKVLHGLTGAVKINYEIHGNSGPHLHCHLFPRYLDDDFPSAPIDYRITQPSPYKNEDEFQWFLTKLREGLLKD